MDDEKTALRPKRLIRSFRVMVKPVGPVCNLDCNYCYYLHKKELLPQPPAERPSDELLMELIRQSIEGQDIDTVAFSWHGGEPLLAGIDFYRRAVGLQRRYAGGKRIKNDIQTNGLLLDDVWCEFFVEHDFLVGLSADGPRELHDAFRRRGAPDRGDGSRQSRLAGGTHGEQPRAAGATHGEQSRAPGGTYSSFDGVCQAAALLRRHGVTFNTLSVVNSVTAKHPAEVYRFLTEELGSHRLQWLPCVEPRDFRTRAPGPRRAAEMPGMGSAAARPGNSASVVTDWSVDADDWGDFLCRTFDLWRNGDEDQVAVNWFESLLSLWTGVRPDICTMADVCGRAVVVERDGAVYPCDHFVYPEYRLGRVAGGKGGDAHGHSPIFAEAKTGTVPQLADMVYSAEQRRFGCGKRDSLPGYCRRCIYRFACNGGCPKDRLITSPEGEAGVNYLCSGFRRFLAHADPYLRQIAAHHQASATCSAPDGPARPARPAAR